jgi:UDP-N-acetylglucosamine 2-epimerase (non-hydrolysing)
MSTSGLINSSGAVVAKVRPARLTTNKIFVLFGTRPEAIKLYPVIKRLMAEPGVHVTVCVTAQHRDMLNQVLEITGITPDIDLDLMQPGQTLDDLSARSIVAVGETLDRVRPSRVVVQGDTTTAMIGALAAYYRRIPVTHIEAGLRSGNIYAPWPEEVNRKIVGAIADQHFAPTELAAQRLRNEAVPSERIHITGNTVVDALHLIKERLERTPLPRDRWDRLRRIHSGRRIILVTAHRRENHGRGLEEIAAALRELLRSEDIAIVLPIHPNPNVRGVLSERLRGHPRAEIIDPPPYVEFVGLMQLADIILTDSGGIQEEAPTLGKPVLIMRETTERPEAVLAGTAMLVGADTRRIVNETLRLLRDPLHYSSMSRAHNPFGDGHAADRIVQVMLNA